MSSREFTLAVVPSLGDRRPALDAVCAALGELLGASVHAETPATYSALAQALEQDRAQFAWMSPALVVLTEERIQLRALMSAVRGARTEYCAAMFVDGERAWKNIEDLRGKRVAWVDNASASGYLVPRITLAARGIDPDVLFGKQLFFGSHADVVRAVFAGDADIGATYAARPQPGHPVMRAGFTDAAPGRVARVLEWTDPIPNDVLVAHGLVPVHDQLAFCDAIGRLSETDAGRVLLNNAFNALRCATAARDALRPLRELIRHAREHGLLLRL